MKTATQTRKPETGTIFRRDFSAKIRMEGENPDMIVFSFSSKEPVDRWWYKEILSHQEGAFNLSRLSGMNWLWNHDSNVVLGKVEDIWLEDERLYARVRWSKKPEVQGYRMDVEDGILTNVSFGYTVEKYEKMDEEEDKTDPRRGEEYPTYLGVNWTVLEISLVSVPADQTVGIGRSMSEFTIREREPTGEKAVTTTVATETPEAKQQREAEIRAMGDRVEMSDLANVLVSLGTPLETARETFLKAVQSGKSPIAPPINPLLGLSDRDQRYYSVVRAIKAAAYPNPENLRNAKYEIECSDEIAKRLGRSSGGGFFMPVRDLKVLPQQTRATYAVGTDPTGGFTVETELLEQNFIDILRNKISFVKAGAQMLSGLTGSVDIPGQATAGQTYWLGEGENIPPSEATFRQVSLRIKTIGALSQYTARMLEQSSIDIEQFIRRDFAEIIAREIDRVIIHGTGTANQPRGILNTAGIGSVSLGPNGGAPTWEAIVNLMAQIEIGNADANTLCWLTTPGVKAKLMTTLKESTGNTGFILADPKNLIGYMLECTNQVRSDLVKGTGTNLSALLLVDAPQVIIGEWGSFQILSNPYADAVFPAGSVQVRAMQNIDIALRHPQAFAAITDVITT